MFDELSVKRQGEFWEVHISNGNKVKHTIMNNGECAIYLDKAAELVEDLAENAYRGACEAME